MKIYKFMAAWCQPCRALSHRLKAFNIEPTEISVEDPKAEALLKAFKIRHVPTLVVEESDGSYQTFVGTAIDDVLLQKLTGRRVY